MKTVCALVLPFFLFATGPLALAAHEGSEGTESVPTPRIAGPSLMVLSKEGIGPYLADEKGMTLYWFTKDSPGKSACTGGCLDRWPIFFREKVGPPSGLKSGEFATITREDGKKQTTFRGYPLYYWAGDKVKGDISGQGVGQVWFVVNPDAFPPK